MSGFGLNNTIKGESNISIAPPTETPNGYDWPKAYIESVYTEEVEDENNGGTQFNLRIKFVSPDGKVYIHKEKAFEMNDAEFNKKMDGFNKRMVHIVTWGLGKDFGDKNVGANAPNVEDYFKAVAEYFNTGENEAPIYGKSNLMWIKVIYPRDTTSKFSNYASFPLSPNFVQRVEANKPVKLTINKTYDRIKQVDAPVAPTAPGTFATPDGLPQVF